MNNNPMILQQLLFNLQRQANPDQLSVNTREALLNNLGEEDVRLALGGGVNPNMLNSLDSENFKALAKNRYYRDISGGMPAEEAKDKYRNATNSYVEYMNIYQDELGRRPFNPRDLLKDIQNSELFYKE